MRGKLRFGFLNSKQTFYHNRFRAKGLHFIGRNKLTNKIKYGIRELYSLDNQKDKALCKLLKKRVIFLNIC